VPAAAASPLALGHRRWAHCRYASRLCVFHPPASQCGVRGRLVWGASGRILASLLLRASRRGSSLSIGLSVSLLFAPPRPPHRASTLVSLLSWCRRRSSPAPRKSPGRAAHGPRRKTLPSRCSSVKHTSQYNSTLHTPTEAIAAHMSTCTLSKESSSPSLPVVGISPADMYPDGTVGGREPGGGEGGYAGGQSEARAGGAGRGECRRSRAGRVRAEQGGASAGGAGRGECGRSRAIWYVHTHVSFRPTHADVLLGPMHAKPRICRPESLYGSLYHCR